MCINRRRTVSGHLADRIFLVAFLHTKPRTRPDWALDGLVSPHKATNDGECLGFESHSWLYAEKRVLWPGDFPVKARNVE
jgi:hypothetical protein